MINIDWQLHSYDFHIFPPFVSFRCQVSRSTRLDEVMKGSHLETLRLMTLRAGEALSSPGALGNLGKWGNGVVIFWEILMIYVVTYYCKMLWSCIYIYINRMFILVFDVH